MSHATRRPAAAIACAAANTLAAPLARAQSTAGTNVAASASNGSGMSSGGGGGFSGFVDNYAWGRSVMTPNWLCIRLMDSTTSLTTATGALGLGTYQSPGTDAKVNNVNILSLTFTHFSNDSIIGTFMGNAPSKFNLYGSSSVVVPVPVIGLLMLVNLDLPQGNLVTTVREWSSTIVAQCYFGTRGSRLCPFVGTGVSCNFFTNLKLNQNFVNGLQDLGQVLQLGMGQVPTGPAKVTAEMSNSWTPVANVGVSYEFTRN